LTSTLDAPFRAKEAGRVRNDEADVLSCASMIGPLLGMELLVGNRRGKLALLRYAYGGWLVVQFVVLYSDSVLGQGVRPGQGRQVGQFINDYLDILVGQHFFLMVLVTPAFVAGAIADEKARGTLQFLLTAQLSDWEIVAGKYVGRLAQVAFLALTPLPLVVLIGGMGALAPLTIVALAVVSIAPLLGLGALGMLASVWSMQTRDAVLRVYLWLGVPVLMTLSVMQSSLIATTTPAWILETQEALLSLNPIYVLDAAWGEPNPSVLVHRLLWNMVEWIGITVVCLALAVWRLRPAYSRQLARVGRSKSTSSGVSREPVDEAPIAWKERVIEGIAPLATLRPLPRSVGILIVFFIGVILAIFVQQAREPLEVLVEQGMSVALVASLLVGVRSSGAICGERERQTWDTLLLTPLRTETIVREKHRGILQATYPYLAAYALPVVGGALMQGIPGFILAGSQIVIIWIGMYFMTAVGLRRSSLSQSSWRSLLATLASGYAYGLAILFITTFLSGCAIAAVGFLFIPVLMRSGISDEVFSVMFAVIYLGLQALMFARAARGLLESAIRTVLERDRANVRTWALELASVEKDHRREQASPSH
jgi:ABC-type transport system involved in multi-copper enzyme maturation permease subunit